MGFSNYFNRFISKFPSVATPIRNLLPGKQEFVWGDEQQAAFEALKLKLTSAPALALTDFEEPFDLSCDASVLAMGGEPLQG